MSMPKKLGMPVDLGQILNLQAETLVIALAAILLARFVKGTTGVGAPSCRGPNFNRTL